MTSWMYLAVAIIAEVIGTTALKMSDGFTRLWPGLTVVIAYGLSFYCLSLTLRTIPVGIVYAVWSGLGIVLIALIGWLAFDQKLDWPAIAGIMLILGGVAVLHLFSKSADI